MATPNNPSVSPSNTEVKALTLRLPMSVYRRLRKHAFDQERPISELVRDAIDSYLRGMGPPDPPPEQAGQGRVS